VKARCCTFFRTADDDADSDENKTAARARAWSGSGSWTRVIGAVALGAALAFLAWQTRMQETDIYI
jgi:protein-S-isoprenylcysteine O-methyltransferase Ste14